MSAEETITIVTMRIEDEPHPAPKSQKGFVCSECGEPVWIAETSLPHMEDGNYEICCNVCIAQKMLGEERPVEEWEIRAADPAWDEFAKENKEDLIGFMIARGLKSFKTN